jgi:glucuronate isomerase
MKDFISDDFLLCNEIGQTLYDKYAKNQNVFDFHCHLNPKDIAEDRRFDSIGELMLEGDHYKWRLMRAFGIPEKLVTGKDVSFKDKFLAFAKALPSFIRNPVYHWVHMELKRYFGIQVPLSEETAEQIWEQANEKLKDNYFSAHSLITNSNVEFLATTDDPSSSLEWHRKISTTDNFKTRVVPTWRPDKILDLTANSYLEYLDELASKASMQVRSLDDLLTLLKKRMDFFAMSGCCIADHGLENAPSVRGSFEEAKAIFAGRLAGTVPGQEALEKFKYYMLFFFGCEYSARSWVMQLHLSVIRNRNTRLFKALGPDCGVDSVGDPVDIRALAQLFDDVEKECGMPKTITYTMNPSSWYPLATLAGSFAGSIPGKMQLGAAWWMLDHRDGIKQQLKVLANTGGLGLSVGMLTDSRSFLSYVRHDYYRRILCSVVGEWVEHGEMPDDEALLEKTIKGVCLNNARKYFAI